MTNEQAIKAQLVLLAFYLQTTIPDELLLLYARDLNDIGPEGLAQAIEALKRDESVWTGRFPLPAKIRSYLTGTIEDRAALSARKILDVTDYAHARATLSNIEYSVASEYGLQSIFERGPTQTPTIYAQLRDLLKATYLEQRQETLRLEMEMNRGLPGNLEVVRREITHREEALEPGRESPELPSEPREAGLPQGND
jgi:hypothetical protein